MALVESLVMRTVLGKVSGAVSWIAGHPWQSIAIGLGAYVAWLSVFTIPGLRSDLEDEIASHRLTKQNYTTAQAQALKAHMEERERWQNQFADLAENANATEREARQSAMGVAERFIAANRVWCQGAGVASGASRPTTAATGGNTGVSEGAGGVSELVGVPAEDVRVCTRNTTRLEAARKWALELEASQLEKETAAQ